MHLHIKRKDWEAPDGQVVLGKTLEVDLINPSTIDVDKARRKGFPHLVDGTFIWYRHLDKDKNTTYYLGVSEIESVWTPAGDLELTLKHEGDGCFGVYTE